MSAVRFRSAGIGISVVLLSMFAVLLSASPSVARADFGIESFDGAVSDASGLPDNKAGSHPDIVTTSINFDTHPDANFFGLPVADGNVKDMTVDLPAGFVGNPTATPALCTEGQVAVSSRLDCPLGSQVGVATVVFSTSTVRAPVYNMVAPEGVPALFAMNVSGVVVHLVPRIRSESDYGLSIDVDNVSQYLSINSTKVDFWGVPADQGHDDERGRCLISGGECPLPSPRVPFLSNPSACSGPLTTTLRADAWQQPGVFREARFVSHGTADMPIGVEGCERLDFTPHVSVMPTSNRPGSATGLNVDIEMPQVKNPDGLATATLRDVRLSLPKGMALSPVIADGLTACTDQQFGKGTDAPMHCPGSSKIGTVFAESPLQEEPLEGGVYVGSQRSSDPESGEMFRMFMHLANPARGLDIRLIGQIRVNANTGQITATFADNPQLPVSLVSVRLKGGARAPLVTPPSCGTYVVQSALTPWSSSAAVLSNDAFTIDQECDKGSPFSPRLEAGTTNPVAGAYSPFILRITRPDAEQNVSRIEAALPKGLLAKLAGVPLCPDGAAAAGNCPAASQVGRVVVGAGAGSDPLYVPQPGKARTALYLAGPYRGAPYSLVAKVPAQAGPFDLGTVTVRNALYVDPVTAQVTAKSDPLPQILQGIPISYRDIRVEVDRPQFTLNPTSCEPMEIASTITSVSGAQAHPASRFQVGNCASLRFRPKLKLQLKGSTTRTGHPALKAVVTYPKEGTYANIARAQVGLPHSEFLDQGNLNKVCKQADLKAGTCPKSSIYGWAKAWTPLLDKPLQGPVYLGVGFGYKLPALVADLNGQIRIMLVGRVDTTKGKGIRNTFEVVPDAPVSRFVLRMKGGRKYGLLENSEDICKKKRRASALFTGQNGDRLHMRPKITAGCGKARRKEHRAHAGGSREAVEHGGARHEGGGSR